MVVREGFPMSFFSGQTKDEFKEIIDKRWTGILLSSTSAAMCQSFLWPLPQINPSRFHVSTSFGWA